MSEATQETSVTSTQDRLTPVDVNENGTVLERNGESKAELEGGKSTVEELFPWISEFKKKCRCLLAQPNIVSLIKLMKFYARNVSVNITECYTKPYRAAKLKDSISETLLFFLFYYRELVEICDRNSYLDKMSDLLAMYMDMELKASRRGKEHHSKIAARLTSCLFVYLENSNEHILDTFIKAKFINRNYHDILDPILIKVFKTIPARPNCDTMYVRYLLIYRLWKKVNNNAIVKNQINSTAILHLGPPPVSPTPFLAKYVLPKVPKSQANSTKFLLLHKFDIEKACKLFVQYCKENREDENQGDLGKPNFTANTPGFDDLEVLGGSDMSRDTNHIDNLTDNVNIPDVETRQQNLLKTNCSGSGICMGKCSAQESTKSENNVKTKHESSKVVPLKPHKPGKVLPRPKSKKTGDILYIDLTSEEITEKVIKKKKQLKLHWLAQVKKKLNTKSLKTGEKKKKKKAQSDASNSSDNLTLPDIIDSTSARSLSTATTPEPAVFSANAVINPASPESLSTVTTPVPENCISSNVAGDFVSVEYSANSCKDEKSECAEKLATCEATTTVTIARTDSSHMLNLDTNCDGSFSEIHLETSVVQLSNTLSHMCETYDGDNSTADTSSENHVNSPSKQNETGSITVSIENDSASVVHKQVSSTERDEIFETSEAYRSPSESSDVAVIFTRNPLDVAIVDLDEYAEDNSGISKSCEDPNIASEMENMKLDSSLPGYLVSNTNRENNIRNDLTRIEDELNNDLTNITFHTNELRLTKSCETYLNTLNNTVQEQSVDNENKSGKIQKVINFAVKEESSDNVAAFEVIDSENTNSAKFHLQDVSQLIVDANAEPDVENKILIVMQKEEEADSYRCRIEQDNEENFEKSAPIKYDILKQCDYKSGEGDQLDGTELKKITELEIVERHQHNSTNNESEAETGDKSTTNVENEYVDEETLIPKINDTLISTENIEDNIRDISNDLLASQESQFRENIDGLSLLASVSQHVFNLEYSEKSLTKPKILGEEISCPESKIKRSHLLSNNGVIKEVSNEVLLDVNNTISCKSINGIAGVWQKINDDKIYGTDLGSEKSDNNVTENESLDMVPLVLETTVDLNSSTLHNNMISVENVTQMIKDSTNVIVNGETVVLLQKSPNSNLYIINKASDSTAECLGEEKKSAPKTTKRISTAMRDIMNHIPINLSRKNADRQEGAKTHRSKVHTASKNKVSKQFKPVAEKFSQHRDKPDIGCIREEILNESSYDQMSRQRSTDTPQSVVELEPVKKPPPPVIILTETPNDVQNTTNERISQESGVINMTTTGRLSGKLSSKKRGDKVKGTSIENLTFKQNIKQEYESCVDDLSTKRSSCYGSQLTPGDSHLQVSKRSYNNINPNNMLPLNSRSPPKIPHVYSTVTTTANLYSLEHEHCDCAPCNMKVSSSQPYQAIPQPIPTCQLSHCACLKCAYEVHYRQYLPPHSSFLQTNSYFVPTDSKPTAKNSVVQEKTLKLAEAALAKLDDDQLLHKIEQSIIDNKVLSPTNVKNNVPEVKYKPEFDSKLPLKKRLKAHAMMSMIYQDTPIKLEKVENYPGTPMMSIAALEARNLTQNAVPVFEQKPTMPSTVIELSPRIKDDSSHHTTEMIRRDYLKDTSLTSINNCANVDEKARKLNQHRRQTAAEVNVTASGCQKNFKTPAQRKEIAISSPSSLKRKTTIVPNHPKSPKKTKKANVGKTKGRQTRSSTRNIPKVDYNYDGIIDLVDPKLNTLTESKRKRKKTGR